MKIIEVVVMTNDTDHAIERVKVAAKMCAQLGDTPLLYRMFKTDTYGNNTPANLMIKVDNTGRTGIKGNANLLQQAIFKGLSVKNPTQALTVTPNNISGFHGTNYIMIPSTNYTAYWNPEIEDLGSFEGYNDKYKKKVNPNNPNLSTRTQRSNLDDAQEEIKQALAGYKQGVPSQREWTGEVIVDTPFYYMLNLQEFLSKYAGKKSKELINLPSDRRAIRDPEYGKIKQELLQARFKTYKDVAWYLSNPTLGYLNWWKEKEESKL